MNDEENKFEIIEGDGSSINMSPVSNYITALKPKKNKNKKIIVPDNKKNKPKSK